MKSGFNRKLMQSYQGNNVKDSFKTCNDGNHGVII